LAGATSYCIAAATAQRRSVANVTMSRYPANTLSVKIDFRNDVV